MDDLLQMLGNMTQQLGPLWDLILLAAYIAGFVFVGVSLFSIRESTSSRHGGMGQHHIGMGIAGICCGICLLSLPTFLDVASMSIFQQSAPAGLTRVSGGSPDQAFINFSVTIVMLVGLCAVIKGLARLKMHAQTHQPGMFWSAIVFLFMGIICINCEAFMLMLGRSIGGSFQEIVTKLFME